MLLNKNPSIQLYLTSFNDKRNIGIFKRYEKLIKKLEKKHVYFEGRLAKYKYLNMDEVIERALNLFNKLKRKYN